MNSFSFFAALGLLRQRPISRWLSVLPAPTHPDDFDREASYSGVAGLVGRVSRRLQNVVVLVSTRWKSVLNNKRSPYM